MLSAVVVIVLAALAVSAFAAWYGAPWAPTPAAAVEAALETAEVGPGDILVDIGAGDGRVLRAAARRGARAIGYELAPLVWVLGIFRTLPSIRGVSLRLGDGFRADFSAATVLFVFLLPRTIHRFCAALLRQRFQHPVRVCTYTFPLPLPVEAEVVRVPQHGTVYVYRLTPDFANVSSDRPDSAQLPPRLRPAELASLDKSPGKPASLRGGV